MMGRDGEQIWLRQSATFTVNGETRTVEIALPLRPGATAEEIEALLHEADGGMERLTRHIDARVAALRGEILTPSETPALAVAATAKYVALPTQADEAQDTSAQPVAPAQPDPLMEPLIDPHLDTAATIAALRERTALALAREAPAAPQPEASQLATAAQPATPQPVTPPPAAPQPIAPRAPAPQPAAAQPAPRPVEASAPGTPLTLQEFLKETQDEFGFTPRTVMEKLGVRSLSGVNYREALETLRRQAIRDGSSAPTPPASNAASVAPRGPSAAPAPRYFEEELDEPEIAFSVEDDEDESLPSGFGPDDEDDAALDALDFEEEVAPPPPPPPARTASAARTRSAAQAQAPATPPAAPTGPADPAEAERARIAELVALLRSPTAGGVPSSHQRTAYRNIVVQELGEEKAKALVAGLYRVTPERLGPEQIDTLLSWGKRDTFAHDSDLVLTALRAERAAQQAASAAGQTSAEPTPAPTPRVSRAPRA